MITHVFGRGRPVVAGPALAAAVLGAVGCGGTAFSAADDASTRDGATGDASRIVVVAADDASPADAEPPETGDGARADAGTNAEGGGSTHDATAACVPGGSCVTSHATTSVCDGDGGCVETHCEPGYLDCDHDPTNGCETEFNTLSCGACEAYCNPAHVIRAICTSTTMGCIYNACLPGYLDCDGDKSNGCETPADSGPCPI